MKRTNNMMVILTLLAVIWLSTPLAVNAATSAHKDGQIVGCTVWTTQEITGYSGGKPVARFPKGKKLKVLKETKNYFLVYAKKKRVCIYKNDILVNVKQYIPSLDIRLDMSQSQNLFNMGNESIPNVTNKKFYTTKGSRKGTECWLKYEPAKKLLNAQKSFNKEGYGIVIYDAYRPYSVTCGIRDGFRVYLNQKTWAFKNAWFGTLGEGWFLAQGVSSHNYGKAVDISLKKIRTGKVFDMPSGMHTLDKRAAYYSWVNANTGRARNAWYLKSVMESVGFTSLVSEWWHFQDNTIQANIIDMAI